MSDTTKTERLTLFRSALEGCVRLLASGEPVSRAALSSIIEQLEYLIDLETGARSDRSGLARMTLDVLTAREVDDAGHRDLAQVLHKVAAAVRAPYA